MNPSMSSRLGSFRFSNFKPNNPTEQTQSLNPSSVQGEPSSHFPLQQGMSFDDPSSFPAPTAVDQPFPTHPEPFKAIGDPLPGQNQFSLMPPPPPLSLRNPIEGRKLPAFETSWKNNETQSIRTASEIANNPESVVDSNTESIYTASEFIGRHPVENNNTIFEAPELVTEPSASLLEGRNNTKSIFQAEKVVAIDPVFVPPAPRQIGRALPSFGMVPPSEEPKKRKINVDVEKTQAHKNKNKNNGSESAFSTQNQNRKGLNSHDQRMKRGRTVVSQTEPILEPGKKTIKEGEIELLTGSRFVSSGVYGAVFWPPAFYKFRSDGIYPFNSREFVGKIFSEEDEAKEEYEFRKYLRVVDPLHLYTVQPLDYLKLDLPVESPLIKILSQKISDAGKNVPFTMSSQIIYPFSGSPFDVILPPIIEPRNIQELINPTLLLSIGVNYMNQNSVFHTDMHGGNVLYYKGRLRLIDFGLSGNSFQNDFSSVISRGITNLRRYQTIPLPSNSEHMVKLDMEDNFYYQHSVELAYIRNLVSYFFQIAPYRLGQLKVGTEGVLFRNPEFYIDLKAFEKQFFLLFPKHFKPMTVGENKMDVDLGVIEMPPIWKKKLAYIVAHILGKVHVKILPQRTISLLYVNKHNRLVPDDTSFIIHAASKDYMDWIIESKTLAKQESWALGCLLLRFILVRWRTPLIQSNLGIVKSYLRCVEDVLMRFNIDERGTGLDFFNKVVAEIPGIGEYFARNTSDILRTPADAHDQYAQQELSYINTILRSIPTARGDVYTESIKPKNAAIAKTSRKLASKEKKSATVKQQVLENEFSTESISCPEGEKGKGGYCSIQ